jgi:hypothetical protein
MFNSEKFGELVLYISKLQEDDPSFGRVKLSKLLFFSDTEAYGRFGGSITGAEYQKGEFGPVARQFPGVERDLIRRGDAKGLLRESFGFEQKSLVPQRDPRLEVFTEKEQALVLEIVAEHRDMTAAEISAKSHREMGWRVARLNELIPYESVFLAQRARAADIERARELALEHGWVEAS